MKKLIIILLVIIFGCNTIKTSSDVQSENNEPPKTIRNNKCESINSFQVFQVLDYYVLANVCDDYSSNYCYGHVVYIQREKGKIYYDDQRINVQLGECPIYVGTFQYVTRDGLVKTVPKVKFINSEIPNPEYNKWMKSKNIK